MIKEVISRELRCYKVGGRGAGIAEDMDCQLHWAECSPQKRLQRRTSQQEVRFQSWKEDTLGNSGVRRGEDAVMVERTGAEQNTSFWTELALGRILGKWNPGTVPTYWSIFIFTLPFSRLAFSTLTSKAFLLFEIHSAKRSELRDRSAPGWEEWNSMACGQIQTRSLFPALLITSLVNLRKLWVLHLLSLVSPIL